MEWWWVVFHHDRCVPHLNSNSVIPLSMQDWHATGTKTPNPLHQGTFLVCVCVFQVSVQTHSWQWQSWYSCREWPALQTPFLAPWCKASGSPSSPPPSRLKHAQKHRHAVRHNAIQIALLFSCLITRVCAAFNMCSKQSVEWMIGVWRLLLHFGKHPARVLLTHWAGKKRLFFNMVFQGLPASYQGLYVALSNAAVVAWEKST